MSEIMRIISSNQTLLIVFAFSFLILILSIVVIFVVAFFQNRDISFYPPRIGKKPSNNENKNKNIQKTTTDTSPSDDPKTDAEAVDLGMKPSGTNLSGNWELFSTAYNPNINGEAVYFGYCEIEHSGVNVTAKYTQIKLPDGRETNNKWDCHGYFLNSQLVLFIKEEKTPDLWVGANVLHFERSPKKYDGYYCLDGLTVYYKFNENKVVAEHLLLKRKM